MFEPDYEQGYAIGVRKVYGMENGEPLNQVIGAVIINNARTSSTGLHVGR